MLKDLQWFLDREGSYILRGTTKILITSEDMARKLFEIQEDRYFFNEKVVIHRARPVSCPSCEG